MLNNIYQISKITFKDAVRNRALYGICAVGLVLFAINIIFTGMFSWELGKVAVDMGLSIISFSGLILIFFLCIQLLGNDIEKRTIYLTISKPVTRAEYILGKFGGMGLVIMISSLILGVFAAISVKFCFMTTIAGIQHQFSWLTFFLSICFITLSLLVLLSLVFLWVSVNTHTFTAFLLSLMTYFIGQNMENVKNIILSTKIISPDAVSMKIIRVVMWAMPNLAVFDLKTTAAYGLPLDFFSLSMTFIYGVSYIGICLTVIPLFFSRRELP